MTGKMKLYLVLLVVGLAMIGGGVWFMFRPAPTDTVSSDLEITVTPGPGSYLTNSQNVSTEVLLKNFQLEQTVSDQQYIQLPPTQAIEPGEAIMLLTLNIQNMHPEYKIIGVSAAGYDASGEQVAWTLDDFLHRMAWTQLDYQESGEIAVHLNFSSDIKSITIFGNAYQYAPP